MIPMLASVPVEHPPAGLPPRAATGSPDDFVTSAHRSHAAVTYAVALKATRDPELAEDLTQESFVRLLAEARAGRYPDNTGAWLYRAVSNLVISRARRTAVARRLAPRLADMGSPDQPDAVAVRHEGQAELRRALGSLSADERTALLLAASGASGIEIAALLGRSHAATRALMCRARARLRERAAAEGGVALDRGAGLDRRAADRASSPFELATPTGRALAPEAIRMPAFPVRRCTIERGAVMSSW